jgi:hypothetical protein
LEKKMNDNLEEGEEEAWAWTERGGRRGDLPCQTDAVGVDAEALRENVLTMDVTKPEHHVTEAY